MGSITEIRGDLCGIFRAAVGGRYLALERVDLGVYLGQLLVGARHAGVLGSDEAGVGGYGLAHPLHGAPNLRLELPAQDLAEAPAERVRLLLEVLAGLPPAVGEDEEAVARDDGGGDDARGVEKAGGREGYYDGPDAQGSRLSGGRPGGGGPARGRP